MTTSNHAQPDAGGGINPRNIPAPPAEWQQQFAKKPAYGFKLPNKQGLWIWEYVVVMLDGNMLVLHSSHDLVNAIRDSDSQDADHLVGHVGELTFFQFDERSVRTDQIKHFARTVRQVDEQQARSL